MNTLGSRASIFSGAGSTPPQGGSYTAQRHNSLQAFVGFAPGGGRGSSGPGSDQGSEKGSGRSGGGSVGALLGKIGRTMTMMSRGSSREHSAGSGGHSVGRTSNASSAAAAAEALAELQLHPRGDSSFTAAAGAGCMPSGRVAPADVDAV